MNVRVSVIVPAKDPGSCIRKCLGSLKKQTLENIEIICVDSGSTDGTAQYLKEAAAEDPRIIFLSCPGASFGEMLNEGIDKASGRFTAFIRPGDTAEPEMLHELYSVSSGMDMVMGGFYLTPAKGESETLYRLPPRYTAIKSFNPLLTFDTSLDQSEIFSINCAVGSAIISREFLAKNSIYFTQIQDSLYHDISFSFKVWACASNVRLLDTASLHCGFRGSTVKNAGKDSIFPVFEEYDEIRYFIRDMFSDDPKRKAVLRGIMMRLQYDSYLSCCRILQPAESRSFAHKAAEKFEADVEKGFASQKYFPSFDWNLFSIWVYDPEKFMDIFERGRKPSLLSRFRKIFKHSKDV